MYGAPATGAERVNPVEMRDGVRAVRWHNSKNMDRTPGVPSGLLPGCPATVESVAAASFGAYGRNPSVDRAECPGTAARWIPYRAVGPVRVALGDPLLAEAAPGWRGPAGPRWVVWYGAPACARGLAPRPMGQEAIVPTATFTLRGRRMARLRSAVHIAERSRLRIVQGTWSTLPEGIRRQVRRSQRAWRARHPVVYGFTLSSFADAIADDRPWFVAVSGGRVVAFCTWLRSSDERGWVLDLMRQRRGQGHGAMDLLIVRGIEEARRRGLEWVSLGIGIDGTGLRRFKEKFRPDWQDRYLLLPGGAARRALGMGAVAAAHLVPPRSVRRPAGGSAPPPGHRARRSPRPLAGVRFALVTALLLLLLVLSVPGLQQAGRDRADQLADRIQATPTARRAVSAWDHRPHPSFGHLALPEPRFRLELDSA